MMFNRLKSSWDELLKKLDAISPFLRFTLISLVLILIIELFISTIQWCTTKCSKIKCPEVKCLISEQSESNKPPLEDCFICCCRNSYLGYIFKEIVRYTTQTSVILMVIVFSYLTLFVHSKEKNISRFLTEVLIGSLSISAIPTGISLAVCAFYDLNLIKYMSGVEIYIAFAGISIIIIGFLSTSQELHEIEKSREAQIQKPEDAPQILAEDAQQITNFPQLTDE